MIKVIANWWGDAEGEMEVPSDEFRRASYLKKHYGEVASAYGQVPANNISIEDHREDAPEFKRTYSVTVKRGIRVSVTIYRSFLGTIYRGGELRQPGGRWFLFDPDRIADKIIDPVLLPEVEAAVSAISRIDAQWRQTDPAEYRDNRGQLWRRVDN